MASYRNDNSPFIARVVTESACGILSAFTVAPLISIVDKAIVSNASGKEKMIQCVYNGLKTCAVHPLQFIRQPSFLFIWTVYGGTYVIANNVEAIYERKQQSSVKPKFVASSVANVSLSVWKDKAFARMFGVGKPKPLPFASLNSFAARDTMTILASFTLPSIIAKKLESDYDWNAKSAYTTAQVVTPVTMQIISTPLHLNGLDIYNNPRKRLSQRIIFIKQQYIETTLARMSRILPAYGIGGVINKNIRYTAYDLLQDYYDNNGEGFYHILF